MGSASTRSGRPSTVEGRVLAAPGVIAPVGGGQIAAAVVFAHDEDGAVVSAPGVVGREAPLKLNEETLVFAPRKKRTKARVKK